MTTFLLLIGSGLFSRAIGEFEQNAFNKMLGMDVDDAGGTGPGSYDVRGNVWHLDCCSPENGVDGEGWTIFNAVFGWTNNATREFFLSFPSFSRDLFSDEIFRLVGTVLGYVFYWIAVIVGLVYMKFTEVRV
jgi:high-affinity iron transporter